MESVLRDDYVQFEQHQQMLSRDVLYNRNTEVRIREALSGSINGRRIPGSMLRRASRSVLPPPSPSPVVDVMVVADAKPPHNPER